MRVLAIETSTELTDVALVEAGALVLSRARTRPRQSAEQLLPLVAELLAEAGWDKSSLDRLGVSVGPGSFTGLRIGIACAQGLGIGLDRPVVGVGALRAMARSVPAEIEGVRCALLDARRKEVFAGAYRGLTELLSPCVLSRDAARSAIVEAVPAPVVWLGAGATLVGIEPSYRAPGGESDAPTAHFVGILTGELEPSACPPLPVYVRDAGATLPDLPPLPAPLRS
jgi:tRNA threonylcarbamoyladenosine biosynthesis protein TsaB